MPAARKAKLLADEALKAEIAAALLASLNRCQAHKLFSGRMCYRLFREIIDEWDLPYNNIPPSRKAVVPEDEKGTLASRIRSHDRNRGYRLTDEELLQRFHSDLALLKSRASLQPPVHAASVNYHVRSTDPLHDDSDLLAELVPEAPAEHRSEELMDFARSDAKANPAGDNEQLVDGTEEHVVSPLPVVSFPQEGPR